LLYYNIPNLSQLYLADFGDILFIIFLQKDPSWDTGYVTNPASFGTAFAQ